ncbi:MAG TPA: hypothetical protein EYN66_11030 [Myxococcales bacterium]|nr:hypothetical protein [Myxococcales bacterium]
MIRDSFKPMLVCVLFLVACSNYIVHPKQDTEDEPDSAGFEFMPGDAYAEADDGESSQPDSDDQDATGDSLDADGTDGDVETTGSDDGGIEDTETPALTCIDELKSGFESDVDCGGPCPACAEGLACFNNKDCASIYCVNGICAELDGFGIKCGGLPNENTTGVINEESLLPSGGLIVTEDGALIENLHITGALDIRANNVHVRNVRIDAGGALYAIRTDRQVDGKAFQWPWKGIVIEHVEAYGTSSAIVLAGGQGNAAGEGVIIRHVNLHDSGSDATKLRSNVLLECGYFHRLGTNEGAHADAVQSRKGNNVEIRYNNCDLPVSGSVDFPGSPYKTNACVIMGAEVGPIDNYHIHHNRMNGGNYTVYVGPDKGFGAPTDVVINDNSFGSHYRYGIMSAKTSVIFSNNRCESSGLEVDDNECACPEGITCGQK